MPALSDASHLRLLLFQNFLALNYPSPVQKIPLITSLNFGVCKHEDDCFYFVAHVSSLSKQGALMG